MSIAVIQGTPTNGGFTAANTPFSANWNANTTAGNYLLIGFASSGATGTVTSVNTGFSLVGNFNNGTTGVISIWEQLNAPSFSNIIFQCANAGSHAIFGVEISGANGTTPRDGSPAQATGTSSSPATGTLSTSQATELILAIMGQGIGTNVSYSYSSPTGGTGASIIAQGTGNNGISTPHAAAGICVVGYSVVSTGSYSGGCTSNRSDGWVGVTIGIVGASAGVQPPPPLILRRREDDLLLQTDDPWFKCCRPGPRPGRPRRVRRAA